MILDFRFWILDWEKADREMTIFEFEYEGTRI